MQTRKSAAQWGELIAAWEASGLSADAFASERGVAESTLRWWKTELARRAGREPRRRPPRPLPETTSGVTLARVVRASESSTSSESSGGVAVLAGGARILVAPGFDRQLLREVVRALAEAR